jgi:hypothetical protein
MHGGAVNARMLALVVPLAAACASSGGEGQDPITQVGDLAPDFTYPDATGAPVSLSDHQGQLVLLASAQMW